MATKKAANVQPKALGGLFQPLDFTSATVSTLEIKPITKSLEVHWHPNEGRPSFDFHGDWNGKDVVLVRSLLQREYNKSKRDMRRAKI